MLESSVKYVLLRNFETIETELMQEHPDIDVLTLEPKKFARLLGLKKNQNEDYRAQYSCLIDGKKVNFDLRSPQDGYYPLKWSYELLYQAVSRDKIKVVNSKNYFWSLLYHALYHKRQVSLDYLTRLYNMALSTHPELTNRVWDRVFMQQMMESYLASIKCSPVEPEDHSVYYNFYENAYGNKESISFRRRLRQYVFKQLSLNKKRIGRIRARLIRN